MKIKKIIRAFQINSCRKVTGLIEKEKVFGLTTMERLLMNVHLQICDDCPKYKKHSEVLDSILAAQHRVDRPIAVNRHFVLPENVKKKIFSDIEKSS